MMYADEVQTKPAGFHTANQSLTIHQQRWRKVKFNITSLDRVTGGGISSRGVVEIAGAAGSGKTQLALHLALTSQLQQNAEGLHKGVVYISTEHPFPARRLVQMEHALLRDNVLRSSRKLADSIFIEHLNSSTSLEQCITERFPVLLENNPVGLLIIDSVAAVYADEQNYIERAHSFRKVVHAIHALQERYDFGTICINQVRSVVDSSTLDDEKIVPALGLAWGSLVHTRMQLSRIMGTNERICRLLFCPTAPPAECRFLITEIGISDTSHS